MEIHIFYADLFSPLHLVLIVKGISYFPVAARVYLNKANLRKESCVLAYRLSIQSIMVAMVRHRY